MFLVWNFLEIHISSILNIMVTPDQIQCWLYIILICANKLLIIISVFFSSTKSATTGSQMKYDPMTEIETVKKGVNETKITMKHMSISAMPAYNGKSVEVSVN